MKILKATLSLCLILSSVVSAQPPKNVIYYIGDGMGFEQVEAAEIYTGTVMSFNDIVKFPYTADCTTYSANASTTDSAAAATALATATKVNNGVISMANDEGVDVELLTLLEYAQVEGKSVGLLTTAYLTHATPAAFGAHDWSRNNTGPIGLDYLNQTKPNVLFGGGGNGLSLSSAFSAGYTVTLDAEGTGFSDFEPDGDSLTDEYFSAQFGSGYMPYKEDHLSGSYPYPLLDEMVTKAIEILSEDPDGFFLMVEGGRVDHACHSNLIKECVHEVIDFANAVETGYSWASGRTDTLILVTADHETGGLVVDGSIDAEGYPVVTDWTTTGHTSKNVPVYAWGVNADMVVGTMDNTDMFNVCIADNTPVIEATNPYPHDGQTDVSIDITLAWTPGIGAENHRIVVWTGTDPITPVVDTSITESQYSLICNAGTTYYWAIDEYDTSMKLLSEGETWTFTTVYPPTASTDLAPSGGLVVPVNVELSWTAGQNVDEYWVYLDTSADPATIASKQIGTSYTPSNLTNSTTYNWKVVSKNSAGEASSDIMSFTTEDIPQPEERYAIAENTVAGTTVSGDFSLLAGSDNNYEVLEEVLNVPNKNGYSTLEHVWTFNLGNAVSAEFYVEAYKTESSDDDDFVFSYSTDGVTYNDMLTVTSIEDTDTSQVHIFPTPPTGTVYVRVNDSDHTKKNQSLDTLYIDRMYIYASEGAIIKHYKASQPVPANGSVDIPLDQELTWTAGDEAVSHEVYFGVGGPDEITGPFLEPIATFDPVITWAHPSSTEIVGGETYFWRVDEVHEDGSVTTGDVWRYTTITTDTCTPTNMLVDSVVLTTERGDKGSEFGVASVKIVDNCGNLVVGAEVTGNLTGAFTETGLTATTGDNGVAVFKSSDPAKKPSFGFDVTGVVKDGLSY